MRASELERWQSRQGEIVNAHARVGGELRELVIPSAIPDSVVDNFENADADPAGVYDSGETLADYYAGASNTWERTTSDAPEGQHGLSQLDGESGSSSVLISLPGDGLNRYPEAGETVGFLIRYEDVDRPFPGIILLADGPPDSNDGYQFIWRHDDMRIVKNDDGGFSTLSDTTNGLTAGDWHWAEVDLPTSSDSTIEFRWYELDAGLERGDFLDSLSANDNDFAGNNGIGFRNAAPGGPATVCDWIRVLD